MHRRSFLTAAGSMALLATGACTSSDPDSGTDPAAQGAGSMPGYKVGDQFKATEPLTVTGLFSDHPVYPYQKDWLLWKAITERTNVTLKLTIVPSSDYGQKRSLLISSGDVPMIIPKTYPGEESPFVSSGAILPVSDYVEHMPNFTDKVEKWELQPELEGLKQEDGKYYVLPGLHEELWPDYTLSVRTDLFDKHGIAIPTTWDEVAAALRTLKQAYPGSIPLSDRFSGNALLNYAGPAFGTQSGWGLGTGARFDAAADAFIYSPATSQFRDLLTFFNGLVAEGLLDRETFTQGDDQAVQKLLNEKSFVISANSQTVVMDRESMAGGIGKNGATIKKIPNPAGPAGDAIGGSRLENGIMISAKAADSPNLIAMLQFIDWLWYSDAGNEFAKWGVEGTTFTKDASGQRKLVDDLNYLGMNPDGKKDLRIEHGFSGGNFAYGGTTELLHSMMSEEELEYQEAMAKRPMLPVDPPAPLSDIKQEQATLMSTPLTDFVEQNTLKFILGERPLDQFDAYVGELEGKGMNKYLELINEAYQASKGN